MSVRMTEIIPPMPSGVAKISVEVGDIITETSFDTELELTTESPIEIAVESRNFTPIGQIVLKMLPLAVQIEKGTAQPSNIDVDLPVEKPVVEVNKPEVTQILAASENLERVRVPLIEKAESGPERLETIPLVPAVDRLISRPVLRPGVAETPSNPIIPFDPHIQRSRQVVEQPFGQLPEEKFNSKSDISQLEAISQRNVAAAAPDIVSEAPPVSKLPITTEAKLETGDLGIGISEKPQVQRTFPSAGLVVQPNASRLPAVETKIVSQISTAILNTSNDTVEIRLDPPELGRVIISITQSDSGLSATVTSEKSEINDLLKRHAELLSRELSKSGFSEASLEFSHRDQQHDRPAFERDKAQFSSTPSEQGEAISPIEIINRIQFGSLDIRL